MMPRDRALKFVQLICTVFSILVLTFQCGKFTFTHPTQIIYLLVLRMDPSGIGMPPQTYLKNHHCLIKVKGFKEDIVCSFDTVLNTTLEILRFLTLNNDRMFPFSCLKVNSGILELEIYQLLIAVVLRTTNAIAGSLRTARVFVLHFQDSPLKNHQKDGQNLLT